jgi:hypothetical protein
MSQAEVNLAVRVLSNTPLKFTNRVFYLDGRITEWQSKTKPAIKWHDDARALFVCDGEYGSCPVMAWNDGMVLLTEENPL